MMTKLRWPFGTCGGLLLIVCFATSAAAQDSEAGVDYKSLYAAAEYDKALAVAAPLDTLEAQQYEALCLLALGRQADASTAIEALVNAAPTFIPSSEDAPPRFVDLVTKIRQKMLPVIARRVFSEGRELYADKRSDEAILRFSLVLKLLADPSFTDTNARQDLETLAKGFIDLATAAAVPVVATAPPPPVEEPAPAALPTAPPKVTLPVALVQQVPPIPLDIASRSSPRLVVVVQIDVAGRVTNATIKESAHPRYDRMVSLAARDWRYTPATRNGAPIASEQVVTIQINR
jgi:TonB family protein